MSSAPVSLASLHKERRQAFLKEIQPYISYAIRSGLGTVIAILLLVSTAYYAYILQADELGYDIRWLAVVLIFPFFILSPIRTYVKQADLLFLLPAESRAIPLFFQPAYRTAWYTQSVMLSLVWLLLVPLLHRHSEGGLQHLSAALLFWGAWFVYKGLLLYGRWQSSQWSRDALRKVEVLSRIVMGAVALLLLWYPTLPAFFLYAALAGLYLILIRLPERFRIHWIRLQQEEQRARARWLHFFSWFVDVDTITGRPERRRGLDVLLGWIRFRRESAYLYLYARVCLRTELWSMVYRLTLVGILLVVFLSNPWWKVGSFVFFSWVTGVQLRALYRHHTHTDWLHVYPLPAGLRERSIGKLILYIHLGILLGLGIALATTEWSWSWVIVVALGVSWAVHRRLSVQDPEA